ncbi:MAG: zinc metallopeptidase [Anaerolineae bacterium]|nr:MAG: zinc metallopeptidase [Anaerolineae bacterium]WKZ44530.1 MAG: zinc metallopeptidase [Anaerolineales bacterium]
MFFDPTYLLCVALPSMVLMGITSWYVRHAYNKWSQIRASSGLTGADAARQLISRSVNIGEAGSADLRNVRVMGVGGNLTDHYNPQDKTLYLSPSVANSPSVAAVAVAAHELGHAMQDAEGYAPLRFRSAIVPMVNIGSNLGWILILAGLLLRITEVAWLGVIFFAGGALFALATLPVELNASARAKRLVAEAGIVHTEEEMRGVNQVLNAAALTYVAGLITAVMQLLYYVMLVSGMGRRRD